jgi:hypothetical protein
LLLRTEGSSTVTDNMSTVRHQRPFIRHRACKWLSDDRGNGPLKPEDAQWCLTSWSPRVIAAGWKFWAVVMPEKVMGPLNMRRWISTYADQGITVSAFADPVQAMTWLEKSK